MSTTRRHTPYALAPGEGEVLRWFGASLTLKAEHPGLGSTS